MRFLPNSRQYQYTDSIAPVSSGGSSGWVFGGLWTLLLLGALGGTGPWAGFHGLMIGGAGLLMWWHPPVVSLPRLWWILAGVFITAGASAFLPAGWFAMPEWRGQFEKLGIVTGPSVVIQVRHAAESLGLFAILLFTGLWFAGHRPSPAQARTWALAFTVGVAFYAIFSKIMQEPLPTGNASGATHYGLFANRNHTATYLAMGAICGLGSMLQAIRDRRFAVMAVALAATGVCLWAVLGWSVSRGGLLLLLVGSLAWLAVLGRGYLGRSGGWVVGLGVFTVVGLFFISESAVKGRLAETIGKAEAVAQPAATSDLASAKRITDASGALDFRVPTALDTLDLIRDFKWTGVGAGQFSYIFPQYRKLSASANDAEHLHPESDWLWLAAETGLPATLALAALVLLAARKSMRRILHGRDRALRGACLIAAMLVPIHGLFDVPGHHFSLAWSAVFLFSLSLRAPKEESVKSSPARWPFRLGALVMMAVAAFLIHAQWWGGHQSAVASGQLAADKVLSLYAEDRALQRAKDENRQTSTPPPGEDRLEQAMAELDDTLRRVPLDRRLRDLQGCIGLHFEDLDAKSSQAFEIARRLDPTWVNGPMRQAWAWSRTDPRQTALLWREALVRAEWMDLHHPGSLWSKERILADIRRSSRGHPELEAAFANTAPRAE